MNRILEGDKMVGETGKFTDAQKQYQAQWSRVPDWSNTTLAALHVRSMKRVGKTTVTEVNPLDPGDSSVDGWGDTPHDSGRFFGARRMR